MLISVTEKINTSIRLERHTRCFQTPRTRLVYVNSVDIFSAQNIVIMGPFKCRDGWIPLRSADL